MRLTSLISGLLLAAPFSRAVFQDEVDDIDFHHQLIGVPYPDATFFHKPRKDEKATLLYTLSDVGILGAVNPGNGAIVWRQPLSRANITRGDGFLRVGDGEPWIAAAHGGAVHTWNAMSGRNVWWQDFDGAVRDLEIMEVTSSGQKDLLVLFEERDDLVARRLDASSGRVIWEYRLEGKEAPLQVSTDTAQVFVIGLRESKGASVLNIHTLDPASGKQTEKIALGVPGDIETREDIMFVGANSAAPILAWTDKSLTMLKINILGTNKVQAFPLAADAVSVDIHAPHLMQSEPHYLLHTRTAIGNRAQVFHVELKSNKISEAYDLPHLPGLGAFSVSSDGSNVYFTRITEEEVLLTASTSHAILARWPFKPSVDVEPIHCVSEVLKKADGSFAVRSAATTRSDDWIMVRSGQIDWSRPEGLTGAVAATWADIPESEDLAKILEQEAHTNMFDAYIHRVKRHLADIEHLPGYLSELPGRVLNSVLSTRLGAKKEGLHRDAFGFNRLAIIATRRGRLYGIDFGDHGKIIWSISAFAPATDEWDVKGMLVEEAKGIVRVRGSLGESITVRVDTGEMEELVPPGSRPRTQSTAIVDSNLGEWMLPVGTDGRVGEIPTEWMPKETVVVRGSQNELKGVSFRPDGEISHVEVVWTFVPPVGQTIATVATRPSHDPVASLGRVLGDRRVNYKYLNPNTILVATIDATKLIMTTHLVDAISGHVLASATSDGVDPGKSISCVMVENWFACSFFGQYKLSDGSSRSLKGYQIVVSDLYESGEANDRGPLGDAANFSSLDPVETPVGPSMPTVISQSFVISAPVTRLAVSQTRQGITARSLLAYMPEAGAIASFPRQVLEPRRPVGRDPTPQEAEAEGLLRYMPAIEIDPRSLISHERDIIGVRDMLTSPTGVESTSLVLAYGVDVFGTRVAPSMVFDILGKGFNKVSMILTVVALFGGVLVLKPLVRKKQIDLRWDAQA